jgi:hypothetical protein
MACSKDAKRRVKHAVQYTLDSIAWAMLDFRRGRDDGAIDGLASDVPTLLGPSGGYVCG